MQAKLCSKRASVSIGDSLTVVDDIKLIVVERGNCHTRFFLIPRTSQMHVINNVYCYQSGMITGAAIVDLSAAYDTVNHRLLIQKLYDFTGDSPLCRVIQNML